MKKKRKREGHPILSGWSWHQCTCDDYQPPGGGSSSTRWHWGVPFCRVPFFALETSYLIQMDRMGSYLFWSLASLEETTITIEHESEFISDPDILSDFLWVDEKTFMRSYHRTTSWHKSCPTFSRMTHLSSILFDTVGDIWAKVPCRFHTVSAAIISIFKIWCKQLRAPQVFRPQSIILFNFPLSTLIQAPCRL